jgi:phosphatidylglycerol:prolipoprotein diacylglycerol transferase
MICGLFLTCYGFFRIALENVREPDRDMPHFPFGLTMGIMLSVPMVLAGLALIAYARRPSSLATGDAEPSALEAAHTSDAHESGTPA